MMTLGNRMKILNLLSEHKIFIGKASEELGITLEEMMRLAKENKIDWTGYSSKDLENDINSLQQK